MTETYNVEIVHRGQSYHLEVPEDKYILSAAYDAGIDLPSSCTSGVCTTCSAQIVGSGSVDQSDAMGLGPELEEEGYVLLCVAYPRSNLKVESEKEDEVYERQFKQPD